MKAPLSGGRGRAQGGSACLFYSGQFAGLAMVFLWLVIVLNVTMNPPVMSHPSAPYTKPRASGGVHNVMPIPQSETHRTISANNDAQRLNVPKTHKSLPVVNAALPPLSISSSDHANGGAKAAALVVLQTNDNAGTGRPQHELQWPPMKTDGSLDPADGFDIMPLTGLKVPRFWSPAPGEDVTKIGSHVNGKETIFLMIASYRDFQCRETITKAFLRADDPSRLFIGAVDQIVAGDIGCLTMEVPCSQDPSQVMCTYRDQISVYEMDATIATGPVTARHIGDRMYRGQYFVMQMDAHCHFANHWDKNIIQQWRQTKNEMAVLSSYLTDIKGSLDKNYDSTRNTRPIMCNSDFEGAMPARYLRHGSQPEDFPTIRSMPMLQPFWAAGFSFSRGHFKVTVPYDGYEPMVFQGEEITIGIRGFTHGYDFYAPQASVVFHEYADNSKRRSKIHMFWENGQKHQGAARKSLARAMSIIKMAPDIDPSSYDHTEMERYGLGNVRSLEYFYKLFLIDPHQRTAVQLCPFVKSGKMHSAFQKYLKPDGMGIDYSKLADFSTWDALEEVFAGQRPGGEKLLRDAIAARRTGLLDEALSNAIRIGLDRTNPDLYNKAKVLREEVD